MKLVNQTSRIYSINLDNGSKYLLVPLEEVTVKADDIKLIENNSFFKSIVESGDVVVKSETKTVKKDKE